jgi:hypothetical protein
MARRCAICLKEAALAGIFTEVEAGLSAERTATPTLTFQPTRLHTLLAWIIRLTRRPVH